MSKERCKACKVVDSYTTAKEFPESMKEINWGSLSSIMNWQKTHPEDFKKFHKMQPSYKDVIKKYGKKLTDELFDKLNAKGLLWGTYKVNASEQEKKEGHFFFQKDIDNYLKKRNSFKNE